MRATEFINPALMRTMEPAIHAAPAEEEPKVQVVVIQPEPEEEKFDLKLNPGMRYGEDGKAKWSPPLQQQLDVQKDAVGPTMNDPSLDPCKVHGDPMDDVHQHDVEVTSDHTPDMVDILRRLAAVLPKQTPVG